MHVVRFIVSIAVLLVFAVVAPVPAGATDGPLQSKTRPAAKPLPPEELARRKDLLSSRVTELYKFCVTGEWRKIEPLLTEESKDIFFVAPKNPILEFSIKNLNVAPDGLAADPVVEIKFLPEKFPNVVTWPQKSRWVYQNDNWYEKLESAPANKLAGFMNPQKPGDKTRILYFEKPEIEIARGNHEYVLAFQNTSKESVSATPVPDNCACMEVSVNKDKYAPGESGELHVKMMLDQVAKPQDFFVQLLALPANQWNMVKLHLP